MSFEGRGGDGASGGKRTALEVTGKGFKKGKGGKQRHTGRDPKMLVRKVAATDGLHL